jgi:subtilisin family serine protease
MSQKHVILLSDAPTRGTTRSPAASATATASPPAMKVEVEELDPRRARQMARRSDVLAVARVVPMKLIKPVALDVAADPAASGATWGVKAVRADTSPFTGDGVVVAVLDTGIDPTHPAFAGVQLERRNFTSESDDDQNDHGTHCAGTIFGRAVNGTRIGVAPGVKKAMIGKVLGKGGGGSDTIMQAIQWAVNGGANVISMSLGIDFPGLVKELIENEDLPAELATSIALEGFRANILLFERLASLVRAQGLLGQPSIIVAAAGNESQRNVHPDFEVAVAPPAAAEGIVSVAAVGESPQGHVVAPFSNSGARVSGPGVGVVSARRGGGLLTLNGTSMATPHVAGVAALWAQKLKVAGSLTGELLADEVVASGITTKMKAGFDPTDIGSGLVQAPQD